MGTLELDALIIIIGIGLAIGGIAAALWNSLDPRRYLKRWKRAGRPRLADTDEHTGKKGTRDSAKRGETGAG